jgi:hypothetical protein
MIREPSLTRNSSASGHVQSGLLKRPLPKPPLLVASGRKQLIPMSRPKQVKFMFTALGQKTKNEKTTQVEVP